MNCPECGGDMRVADSRPRDGGVWRRRKCAAGHTVYTIECQTAPPIEKVGRKRDEVRKVPAKPKKPKPPAKRKREPQAPYSPALKEWNLKVTADSPLWLRSLAMNLG
jgi:rRNA maturation protein Nop10